MKKEFIMRGKTASGETEVLNFTGYKEGYAYRLVELQLFPSVNVPSEDCEATVTITGGKTAVAPTDPDFLNEGLIATSFLGSDSDEKYPMNTHTVINDTFLITQNLILMASNVGGSNAPINWQCRFVMEKMNGPEEAANNYKQYLISDGS